VPGALEVRDPATGTTLETLATTDERAISTMVATARATVGEWSGLAYDERAVALLAFRDLLLAEVDDLATTTARETGKPIAQARNEIRAAAGRVEWFVEHVPAALAERTVTESTDLVERVTYEPVGVVAHVSAWNYPYFVGLNTIAPALLVGDAVVYKPSELATLTGLRVTDLLHRAGVPPAVLQVVVGGGGAGAALVGSAVDTVCFTGSYATGLRVAAAAARNLTRVQLELGGKDAAYVCDDVDVERVAPAVAEGAFYNAGQSCCAIERLYVHDRVFEPFVDALVATVEGYRVGDPLADSTDVGPLARADQPGLLAQHVDDAVAKGARVLVGGSRIDRAGSWFEPTVLVDVDHTMRVMRDESFGPVIGVQRVRDDDEAYALMDDTEYGLTAAVFSDDRARALRLLERLDAGSVYWNTSDRTSVCLPWAGRRHSGLGVSLSESGVRALAREKAWHLRPRV
jgi:acyl-CoA reductase-like NAD-dependent aldehyde dehydrogenase